MSIPVILTFVMTTLLQAATPPRAAAPMPAGKAAAAVDALAVQVMLDRAGFSPGVIDGRTGKNTDKALAMFKESGGNAEAIPADALTQYTITAADASGPYEPNLPTDMMAKSKLASLAYKDPLEALAERFHSAPALLQRLNATARFAEGEVITVPNVSPLILPVERPKVEPGQAPAGTAAPRSAAAAPAPVKPPKPDVVVAVSRAQSSLTVRDDAGQVIFYAPVTTGSEHDPLPIGEWKINGVQFNPTFRYNPALFWDAEPSHTKAVVPAGPNSPVGVVWIDLSKDHYGIHGTPEPNMVGRTESHGCVRLTNWDALRLAALVKPGTRVIFAE